MTKYIEKSALLAEIENYISNYKEIVAKTDKNDLTWVDSVSMIDAKIDVLQHLLSLIDTLEVKEMELTWEDVREICTQSVLVEIDLGGLVSDEKHYTEVLKRFKAQKGE